MHSDISIPGDAEHLRLRVPSDEIGFDEWLGKDQAAIAEMEAFFKEVTA